MVGEMRGPQPKPIVLTERQEMLLRRITRCPTNPQWLVERAGIILEMAAGANNRQVARHLGLIRSTPRLWRGRWLAASTQLAAAEAEDSDDKALSKFIESVLADRPRAGAPAEFTAEQVVQIVALACENPETSGRPISRWTPRELADEAVKRGIVQSISPMTVWRFLKGGRSEATSKPLLAQCRA
jgi:putative transposase